jgi:hypothetical protein
MRKFVTSRRRRYALAFLVVGASLAVMGAQCAPQPTKPPAPTGLSIAPTSHDFGELEIGTETPLADQALFTVTNNGPEQSGTLTAEFENFNPDNFGKDDGCTGNQLDAGESCEILVAFTPLNPPGLKATDLVVSSDEPADGTATAKLSGTAVDLV